MEDEGNSVTMVDVLKEQEAFEEDANAVLGASDDKNCTFTSGYVKRQALYACMTCCPSSSTDSNCRAGICLACSLNCHENHDLIELYTKRSFRCDCGGPKFPSNPCTFISNKIEPNLKNQYNQNFSGIYCICHRPYPDPEATEEDEMIQCIICEDWLHSQHLNAKVPPSDHYSEMICQDCMKSNEFLTDYLCFKSTNDDTTINDSFDGSVTDQSSLNISCSVNGNETIDETKNSSNQDTADEKKSSLQNDNSVKCDHSQPDLNEDVQQSILNSKSFPDKADDPESPKMPNIENKEMLDCNITRSEISHAGNITTKIFKDTTDIHSDTNIHESEKCGTNITTPLENSSEKVIETQDIKSIIPDESCPVPNTVAPVTPTDILLLPDSIEPASLDMPDDLTNNVVTAEDKSPRPTDSNESIDTEDSTLMTTTTHIEATPPTDNCVNICESQSSEILPEKISHDDLAPEPIGQTDDSNKQVDIQNIDSMVETGTVENLNADIVTDVEHNKSFLNSNTQIDDKPKNSTDNIDVETKMSMASMQVDEISLIDNNTIELNEKSNNLANVLDVEMQDDQTEKNISKKDEVNEENLLEPLLRQNKNDISEVSNLTSIPPIENVDMISNDVTNNDNAVGMMNTQNLPHSINTEIANPTENSINKESTEGDLNVNNVIDNNKPTDLPNILNNNCGDKTQEIESTIDNEMNTEDSKKRKFETDNLEKECPITEKVNSKKQKLDVNIDNEENKCIKPITLKTDHSGAAFWPCDWRTKLCRCSNCLKTYSLKNVLFLIDSEDTVSAYEALGKIKANSASSQYEKGMEALSSLGHVQQINAITEYNKMKEKLLDFLKTFKDKKEVVKEEDIKGFFAGMKPKREPDGVYFCR